jgi:hypothetical protein
VEFTKEEVAAVEVVVAETEVEARQLSDLQLALVGGGIGSVIVG